MRHLCSRLKMNHLRTSAYHPQSDAKCERTHFSVHNLIVKLDEDKVHRLRIRRQATRLMNCFIVFVQPVL